MTINIQENIFWLQVPVNDIETVQVVQCKSDLGSIKFGDRIRKPLEGVEYATI